MSDIGRYIVKFRKAKGLTQEQLGTNLHVTRQTVSSWETGRTMPDVETLSNIAQALDVSIEQLIYGRDIRSNARDTSIYKRLAGISANFVITCIGISILIQPYIHYTVEEYSVMPEFIYMSVVRPLIYLCGAICFLSLLSILGDIVVPNHMIRKILLYVGLSMILFFVYSVLAIYEFIPSTIWIRKSWFLMAFNPYIFVVPGICLFLGWNRHF